MEEITQQNTGIGGGDFQPRKAALFQTRDKYFIGRYFPIIIRPFCRKPKGINEKLRHLIFQGQCGFLLNFNQVQRQKTIWNFGNLFWSAKLKLFISDQTALNCLLKINRINMYLMEVSSFSLSQNINVFQEDISNRNKYYELPIKYGAKYLNKKGGQQ